MGTKAYFITAEDLYKRGKNDIPHDLISSKHLIYSSPATLSFNSPGAQGFGVKRAGLAVPGSVMLLVSPGCCGRNTTILGDAGGYSGKIFHLLMDETDIVTGRHLTKIPEAIQEVCSTLPSKPSVVMICITCVDALLGTDMERVCRIASEDIGIPVRPCYMYALTREGIKPPMASVRQTVYSLLKPAEKDPKAANILGFFSPLEDECEIYALFNKAGVTKVREIGRCNTYEEYLEMAQANFNLILNPEVRFAASDMEKDLQIPYIELTRLYQLDKIQNQYRLLGNALNVEFDDTKYYEEAKKVISDFYAAYTDLTFSIGECINANPFELAVSLIRYGFKVAEIFGTIEADDFHYLRVLSELSPDTKIYSNLSPTMLYYDADTPDAAIDITLGRDAAYYHPSTINIPWNSDRQPFGYQGLVHLFNEISGALSVNQNPDSLAEKTDI